MKIRMNKTLKKTILRCCACLFVVLALSSISWAAYRTEFTGQSGGKIENWYFSDVGNSVEKLNLFNKDGNFLTAESFGEGNVTFTLKANDDKVTAIPARVKIKIDTSALLGKVYVYDENDISISYERDAVMPIIFKTSFVGAMPETLEAEKDKNIFGKWLTIDSKNITLFDYVVKPQYAQDVSIKIEWRWNPSYYVKTCECVPLKPAAHINNPDMTYRAIAFDDYKSMITTPVWKKACFSKYVEFEKLAKLLSKPSMNAEVSLIGEQYV